MVDHVLPDATWQVSLDQLQHDEPAAARLLQQAAFLAPEPLSMFIFDDNQDLPTLPDALQQALCEPIRRDRTLGALHRYALARRAGDSIQMHRLVQAAVRRLLPEPERLAGQLAALQLLQAALPADIYRQPHPWPRWQQLLPHVLFSCAPDPSPAAATSVSWLLDRARHVPAVPRGAGGGSALVRAGAGDQRSGVRPAAPHRGGQPGQPRAGAAGPGRAGGGSALARTGAAINEAAHGPQHPMTIHLRSALGPPS